MRKLLSKFSAMQKFGAILCSLFISVVIADAAGLLEHNDQHMKGTWYFENTGTSADFSGNIVVDGTSTLTGAVTIVGTLTHASTNESLPLPLFTFFGETTSDGSTVGDAILPLTTSTTPKLDQDDLSAGVVWVDADTSAIQTNFIVPRDYNAGGGFRVMATESDSTTPNKVDFDVYVNRSGSAADAAATGQTPVALNGTTSTPSLVTLTVSTDFASLAAGDNVTLRLWRDNVADGTGDLEVKAVDFIYTRTQ
ncbi:MAG: hypothetical protein GY841_23600 [FCB group bacterium]|nr:hypothetical protein [FCB group bacterium]